MFNDIIGVTMVVLMGEHRKGHIGNLSLSLLTEQVRALKKSHIISWMQQPR